MEKIILALQGCVKIKLKNTYGAIVIAFSIKSHKFTILGQNGREGLAPLCAIFQEGDENPSANSSSIHRKKRHKHTQLSTAYFLHYLHYCPRAEFCLAG